MRELKDRPELDRKKVYSFHFSQQTSLNSESLSIYIQNDGITLNPQ